MTQSPDLRKTVTVLFIDLVDSTALAERFDPELLHGLLQRYYTVCADAIADHGGVVEKFIGDAVMAVFGLPVNREDDALRAVHAATRIVAAVPPLAGELAALGVELRVHCGIAGGEVAVVSAGGGDLRIVGDTVNTAARLQSAAAPGEILVNSRVARLVSGRMLLTELDPLPLKGKTDPEPAWRVSGEAPAAARAATPLIGRDGPLQQLADCYRHAVIARRGGCVHVVGDPGVGKTRLVDDFLSGLPSGATATLTGSCQPYGHDVTFHPLRSMLSEGQPGGLPAIERLLCADEEGSRACRSLAAVIGDHGGQDLPTGIEETIWALTHLFGVLAASRPLVVVWDDLQWAAPTLLDLIDGVAAGLTGLPVLMICCTREHDASRASAANTCTIQLGPLSESDVLRLVSELVPDTAAVTVQDQTGVADSVANAARLSGGNPLFATLLVDALGEDPGLADVPETISALLRARVDRLAASSRRTLQWAATCGRDFDAEQLGALNGYDGNPVPDLPATLRDLGARSLLSRRASGRLHFPQPLVRDTCYAMVAKGQRARWHALLSERATLRTDAMYHAEKAVLMHREVGLPADARQTALCGRAVRLLAEEGTTALHRRDTRSSRALLERALRLADDRGSRFADLHIRLSEALLSLGEGVSALRVLDDGLAAVDGACRITLSLQREIVAFRLGDTDRAAARAALDGYRAELAERADDHLSWCLFHQLHGFVELDDDRSSRAEGAFAEALACGRRLHEPWIEDRLSSALCELAQWTPTPVEAALSRCDALIRRFAADRLLLIPVLATRARLLALAGRLAEAHHTLATARSDAADLHAALPAITVLQAEAVVLSLTADHAAAADRFEQAATLLQQQGHRQAAASLRVYAARESARAGRCADAASTLDAVPHDQLAARARVWWGLTRARLAVAAGEADGLARADQVLATLDTDDPCLRGDAWYEYALIARAAGQPEAARRAAAEAEACYAAKGATLPAATARAWAAGEEA